MRKNIWRPSNCQCVVEEELDDVTLAIVGLLQVVHKCTQHAGVADGDLYGVLITNLASESNRVRDVLRMLLGNDLAIAGLDGLRETTADGGTALKEGVEYRCTWSGVNADRVLNVSLVGFTLSGTQKTALTTACNVKYGTGKVVFL